MNIHVFVDVYLILVFIAVLVAIIKMHELKHLFRTLLSVLTVLAQDLQHMVDSINKQGEDTHNELEIIRAKIRRNAEDTHNELEIVRAKLRKILHMDSENNG